jgi:hypothetical protein
MMLLIVTGSLIGISSIYKPANVGTQPNLSEPSVPPQSLTGVWKSNDGGKYYLRHNGNVVWWIGLSGGNDGRTYSNTFRGTITTLPGFDGVIDGEFVDVPRGAIMNSGKLLLDITQGHQGDLRLRKISGAFGTDTWTKVSGVSTTPYTKPPRDLTGIWYSYPDEGHYFLRHIGYNTLWWIGISKNGLDGMESTYYNVFKGEIFWGERPEGTTIIGEWVDVPRGVKSSSGMLVLNADIYSGYKQLNKVSETGGFGSVNLVFRYDRCPPNYVVAFC